MVLELYVQGRSYDEVAAVTGYPADDIRAMALAAGVARPHRVEAVCAAWRSASRAKLNKMCHMDLLLAWVDGVEIEDLAAAYNVPADLLWDVVADEFARVNNRRVLTVRPLSGWRSRTTQDRPTCEGTVCLYGCAHTCAATLPDPEPAAEPCGLATRPWPPRGDLNGQITLNDDGTVTWNWFSNPACHIPTGHDTRHSGCRTRSSKSRHRL